MVGLIVKNTTFNGPKTAPPKRVHTFPKCADSMADEQETETHPPQEMDAVLNAAALKDAGTAALPGCEHSTQLTLADVDSVSTDSALASLPDGMEVSSDTTSTEDIADLQPRACVDGASTADGMSFVTYHELNYEKKRQLARFTWKVPQRKLAGGDPSLWDPCAHSASICAGKFALFKLGIMVKQGVKGGFKGSGGKAHLCLKCESPWPEECESGEMEVIFQVGSRLLTAEHDFKQEALLKLKAEVDLTAEQGEVEVSAVLSQYLGPRPHC